MRHFNLYKGGLLAAPAALILAGCGGTDPASNGFPSNPSSQTNPTGPGVNGGSSMAALTFNKTYQYAVSGTVTKAVLTANNTAQTISGAVTNATLTRVVSDGSPALGSAGFQVTDTLTYTLQGEAPAVEVSTWYVTQNPDNSLNLAGITRFNNLAVPNAATPYSPGTFATGANLSSGANYVSFPNALPGGFTVQPPSNSPAGTQPQQYAEPPATATIETAFTALGQESVPTTTGGPFTAWKTQYTQTEDWNNNGVYQFSLGEILPIGYIIQSNISTTSVDDWVPSLGMPVRSQVTLTRYDQPVTSANFNPPAWNTPPAVTYTYGPILHTKETLTMVMTSHT